MRMKWSFIALFILTTVVSMLATTLAVVLFFPSSRTALAVIEYIDTRVLSAISPRDKDIVDYQISARLPSDEEVSEFQAWADERNIHLFGIDVSSQKLVSQDGGSIVYIDISTIPGIHEAYAGLKLLPDYVLHLMEDKAIYLSSIAERPYTIISVSEQQDIIPGFVLTQPMTKDHAIRELAHIINFHGIQGMDTRTYADLANHKQEFDSIFFVPLQDRNAQETVGYISDVAKEGVELNFAEHLLSYVLEGRNFRAHASTDPKLAKKYIFIRDVIFAEKEY